jgi:4-amino-4-deoxy-L-arabinose transferase-like glycosyltransferase
MKARWVLLAALILFGWNVWGYALWAPDEPFFGEGAREMLRDGHWVVPHINGEVNTHKPPLFFWLIALLSLPVGAVTSVTARLPSILAALGSVALTMRLGRRMSERRTAVLAGVMLMTTHMFWDKARWAQIDSLLCFLILVALSAFEAFRAGDADGRRAGVLFWIAAALAVLAKGPVGVLLPLGIALVTLALDRRLGAWRRFAPFSGPLAFLATLAPWVVATTIWGGGYSVWAALREHFVERAVSGMHHVQPFWYYAQVLPYALLPWSFLVPGALLLAWRRRREVDDRLLLVWSLFVVLFFSVSTEKRDLYILPAVPAFALLAARLVAAIEGWWTARVAPPARRWITLPQGVVGAVMIGAGVIAPLAAPRFGDTLVTPAWVLGIVLLLGGLAIVVASVRGRPLRAVHCSAAAMAATLLVAVTLVYPALDPQKSGRELARVVRDETAAAPAVRSPLFGLGLENVILAVNFYSDGVYLTVLDEPIELTRRVATGEAHLLASAGCIADLPPVLKRRLHPIYSTHLSSRDVVLARIAATAAGATKDTPRDAPSSAPQPVDDHPRETWSGASTAPCESSTDGWR